MDIWVQILLAVIAGIVLFVVTFNVVDRPALDDQLCKISVGAKSAATRATFGVESATPIKNLECHTNFVSVDRKKVEINGQKQKRYNDISSTDPGKVEEAVYNVLADQMYACWNTFGQGKVNVFGDFDNGMRCVVCAQVNFDKTLYDSKDLHFREQGYFATHFYPYLAVTNIPGRTKEETYLQFLSDGKLALPDVQELVPIDLSRQYAVIYETSKAHKLLESLTVVFGQAGDNNDEIERIQREMLEAFNQRTGAAATETGQEGTGVQASYELHGVQVLEAIYGAKLGSRVLSGSSTIPASELTVLAKAGESYAEYAKYAKAYQALGLEVGTSEDAFKAARNEYLKRLGPQVEEATVAKAAGRSLTKAQLQLLENDEVVRALSNAYSKGIIESAGFKEIVAKELGRLPKVGVGAERFAVLAEKAGAKGASALTKVGKLTVGLVKSIPVTKVLTIGLLVHDIVQEGKPELVGVELVPLDEVTNLCDHLY
ncbi:hypothetical protein A3B57_00740 [Microgenomates group bacterium RIFCSPLOWO2_01_FULL_47_10]|nr:MAG: hypothetical protein A3B57_00740 [Microgenomates group bacterium RIFCSPLOWO2_01_FULL_47_10]